MKKFATMTILKTSIRAGFVPLNDAAPLIIAHELGLFKKHEVRVTLQPELGWASIRDKIIFRELEAAHALAALPLAAALGLGSVRCQCLTALVLNLNGNAITLSEKLWRAGIRDATALKVEIARLRREKTFTFGIVHRFSSHRRLLSNWLSLNGIDPERDVRMVVLPPSEMAANLSTGNLDGFCVGEPWNSAAIAAKVGWCVETSQGIDPGHPEKVLMVRKDFAEKHEPEHFAMLAALIEACEFCDQAENAEFIARTLARREYLDTSVEILLRARREFDFGHGMRKSLSEFCIFHRGGANEPTSVKAAWALEAVRGALPLGERDAVNQTLAESVFRPDMFSRAVQVHSSIVPVKGKYRYENEPELQTT